MNAPIVFLVFACSTSLLSAAENLIPNGGFEFGTKGWRIWSRSDGTLTVNADQNSNHSGRAALHLEHRGAQDWSLEPAVRIAIHPGDVVQLECWVKVQGHGSVTLCASTWDQQGKVVAWSAGESTVSETADWQHLAARVVVSDPVSKIQPRLIGAGPIEIWVDDYSAVRGPNLLSLRPAALPPTLLISNALLLVEFNTSNAIFSVQDRRAARRWVQKASSTRFVVKNAAVKSGQIECILLDAVSGVDLVTTARLDPGEPELAIDVAAQGQCPSSIPFPHPFVGATGDYLVVPMNEGISFPVDDASISPTRLIAYGGHGICMGFFGLTDGERGQMAILETPDDASIRIDRLDGRLAILPEWDPQLSQFGSMRRLRYIFF